MKDKFLQEMYLKEYKEKIFAEFTQTMGIQDKFENFDKYKDLFKEWLLAKRKAASCYVQLFDYMKDNDDLPNDLIAEFNKGCFDTIAMEMATYTEHQSIVISKYASTISKDSGIVAYTGNLMVMDEDVFVSYNDKEQNEEKPNCNAKINDAIDTLITQIPYDYATIYPFIKLLAFPKTLFIGTYGSLDDKNCEENLQKISMLYDKLSDISYRKINYCAETQDNFYLSAIRVSSEQKVLRKVKVLVR